MTENIPTISSGNTVIDSIINYKCDCAKQYNIDVKTEIQIPPIRILQEIDATIIFGNLLDNAIEALQKVPAENRLLEIMIRVVRNQCFIKISNTCVGEHKWENGRLLSDKSDKSLHGLGLQSVEKSVLKYDGEMHVENAEGIFTVSIMLYIKMCK